MVAGAGNETTTRLIGWAGKVLAEHPDQRRELVADRSLIPNAIEELLRYEPPAPARRSVRARRRRGARPDGARGQRDVVRGRRREPRRPPVRRRRSVRHPPRDRVSTSRSGTASTSASAPRSRGSKGAIALEELLARFPEWEVDLEPGAHRVDVDGARLRDAPRVGALTAPPVSARRRYDSTLRRERAAETRARIVAAGAELLRGSSIRDWRALTMRAVAERAGVNERTVYRHFANERALRDAVMQRCEEEAGVDLSDMALGDIADVAARVLRFVSAYPIEPRPPLDPTLAATNERRHDALLAAVAGDSPRWSATDREVAAAMFDALWAVDNYERLVGEWGLDAEQAIRGMTWVIELVAEAVRDGRRPPRA